MLYYKQLSLFIIQCIVVMNLSLPMNVKVSPQFKNLTREVIIEKCGEWTHVTQYVKNKETQEQLGTKVIDRISMYENIKDRINELIK